jgi:carbonic anhydrase/acetyltransferase-like protein (isoleucine patch superfamily)
VSALRARAVALLLRAIQAVDRVRLRALPLLHPGLEIDPSASSNLAHARYALGPGARLRIGPRVVTERIRGALCFTLGAGAQVEIGEGAWLRTELGPVHIVAFDGARLTLGPDAFLNGCHLSAKRELRLGRRAWVGPGSRVFDADQHDFDAERPEVVAPVTIGDYAWVASDVTVLRGVTIGEHCVIGARSLVTRDVPPHSLAFGSPATVRGRVGDRSRTR